MRNWHPPFSSSFPPFYQSDITYEELTHIISGPFIILSRDVISISRTLPMRNWHDCRESWKLVLFQWSAVGHYLWGIDTLYTNLSLKRSDVGHYLWGIDTSFFFELSDGTIDWSDITYEELTHAVFSEVVASSDTSSGRTLPMRNWHISRSYIFFIIMSDITYEELTLKNQHT